MVSNVIGQMMGYFKDGKPSTDPRSTESDDRESVDLYACSDCNLTYIKNEMQSCPKCGEAVDRTPKFSDLGIELEDRG